jgi:hypothetical protein
MAAARVAVVDKDVDALAALVVGGVRVLVVRLGELGDDVPCVDEAGDLDVREGGDVSTVRRAGEVGSNAQREVC